MTTLYFQTAEGETIELQAKDGASVMEAAVAANVPGIDAECGGACACATCHVYVAPEWFGKLPAPIGDEIMMLDDAMAVEANSRLSCQIILDESMEGLKLTLAPNP